MVGAARREDEAQHTLLAGWRGAATTHGCGERAVYHGTGDWFVGGVTSELAETLQRDNARRVMDERGVHVLLAHNERES